MLSVALRHAARGLRRPAAASTAADEAALGALVGIRRFYVRLLHLSRDYFLAKSGEKAAEASVLHSNPTLQSAQLRRGPLKAPLVEVCASASKWGDAAVQ